jgi:pyrroline-5-carboxylate reductase
MKKSLGFIGGGKDTRILLQAFDNRKLKFRKVVVTDVNPIVCERLKNEYPFVDVDSASVAARQNIVFLSLDENLIMDTLGLISAEFSQNTILVSLSHNINFAKLALRLQNVHKIARVLPSSSAFINEAYTAVSFSSGFPQSDKDDVLELFGNLGTAIEVPEDKLQTYSTISTILPVYFWHQWKEIVNMGVEMGLTEKETIDLISDSVRSSLHMSYRSGLTEDQVVDLMPLSPFEDNEQEIREVYRRRLVDLYRRHKPEPVESNSGHTQTRNVR